MFYVGTKQKFVPIFPVGNLSLLHVVLRVFLLEGHDWWNLWPNDTVKVHIAP